MLWMNAKRIFRSGFVNFFRNAFVSLSAVLIMVVTLFVLSLIIFSSALLNQSLEQIKEKVDVNVYMMPNTDEETVLAIKREIESLPETESVEYVSRDQALENFQIKHRNNEEILEALDELEENPLGAVLNIKAKETSQYQNIANFLEQNYPSDLPESLIDKVNYNDNKETIDKLTSIVDSGERLGVFITIIFIIISIIITFNTIRLAMYISRDEIKVMKLVGASGMYITGPFVVAGVMYGFTAAIITLVLLYPIAYWIGPTTEAFFYGTNVFNYYLSSFAEIFLIIIFSGVLIGSVSSFIAIKRFLKEQKRKKGVK